MGAALEDSFEVIVRPVFDDLTLGPPKVLTLYASSVDERGRNPVVYVSQDVVSWTPADWETIRPKGASGIWDVGTVVAVSVRGVGPEDLRLRTGNYRIRSDETLDCGKDSIRIEYHWNVPWRKGKA